MMHSVHERYMALALSLAQRGLGTVWPNPSVGCVIVKDGVIYGRGHTAHGGRPHAETQALLQAKTHAQNADIYVTLEPCSHHGRTPPCAQALINANVKRVIVACQDPDPRVSGSGIDMLKSAGIEVITGVLSAQAKHSHLGFFNRVQHQRPFVTLKLAVSLDGKIAMASGESQWITGPLARRKVHLMRAQHDAILIGAGTLRADNPSLTVRDIGLARKPVRIIASHTGQLPMESQLCQAEADAAEVWLCHSHTQSKSKHIQNLTACGITSVPCQNSPSKQNLQAPGQLDTTDMMRQLADRGLTRIFCEGGATLAASLLREGLVDEIALFSAGKAIGHTGLASIADLGCNSLKSTPQFELTSVSACGPDVLQTWRRAS